MIHVFSQMSHKGLLFRLLISTLWLGPVLFCRLYQPLFTAILGGLLANLYKIVIIVFFYMIFSYFVELKMEPPTGKRKGFPARRL